MPDGGVSKVESGGDAAALARLAAAVEANTEAVKANNKLCADVLEATKTMIQVCTNIDATCRAMLAKCEQEDEGDGRQFFETMTGIRTTLESVDQGVKALPEVVSSKVTGDVAEAVRLFGSEVEEADETGTERAGAPA